jgi:hypothetical protein
MFVMCFAEAIYRQIDEFAQAFKEQANECEQEVGQCPEK